MKSCIYEIRVSKINATTKSLSFDKSFSKIAIVEAYNRNDAIGKAKSLVANQTNVKPHLLNVSSSFDVKEITATSPHVCTTKSRPYCYMVSANKVFSANEFALLLDGRANVVRNARFMIDGTIKFEVFNGSKWIEKTIVKDKYNTKTGYEFVNAINMENELVAVMHICQLTN